MRRGERSRTSESGSETAAEIAVEPQTVLGPFEPVAGTRTIRAVLNDASSRDPDAGSGSFGSSSYASSGEAYGVTQNVLFYSLDARTSRWLFPSNRQWIVLAEPLTTGGRETLEATPEDVADGMPDADPVRAFLYLVVSRDTDGNGRLGQGDQTAAAVSDADGSGYTVLLPRVDRLMGTFRTGGDGVLVVYEAEGAVRGAEVDVAARRITRRVSFPSPPTGRTAD